MLNDELRDTELVLNDIHEHTMKTNTQFYEGKSNLNTMYYWIIYIGLIVAIDGWFVGARSSDNRKTQPSSNPLWPLPKKMF